ncbi:hypothetical protein [Saccharothrix sp. HUAS TT1]|uniref:hypothetical protein n=1 Tax=unclassified Saccharothrix TaxID=2593673 RepID=UPI00345C2474
MSEVVAVVFGLCALSFAGGCVLTAIMLRRDAPPEPESEPAPEPPAPRVEPPWPPQDYATKPIHRNPVVGFPTALPSPPPRPNLVLVPDPRPETERPVRLDEVRRMHVVREGSEPATSLLSHAETTELPALTALAELPEPDNGTVPAQPTAPDGRIKPPAPDEQVAPTALDGQVELAALDGQVEPTTPDGRVVPTSLNGQVEPTSPDGQVEPASPGQPSASAEPVLIQVPAQPEPVLRATAPKAITCEDTAPERTDPDPAADKPSTAGPGAGPTTARRRSNR